MRRFFLLVAKVIEDDNPALSEKLRHASPHWMRHTHATHALARGRAQFDAFTQSEDAFSTVSQKGEAAP